MRVVAGALVVLAASVAEAEVTRFDVARRERVGTSSYEKIVGTIRFRIDPRDARNRVIADIDRAATDASGRIEFSADLYILQPIDASQSNGVVLVDVPNRGAKLVLQHLTGAPGRNDFVAESDFGDGLLTKAGYTIAWVGWQFDVPQRPATISFQAPAARDVIGVVKTTFTSNARTPSVTVTDLRGYPPIDPSGPDSALTVRDGPFGNARTIPREQWQLEDTIVSIADGFEPGRTYEVAYRASNPAIAGTGLAAVRDVVSWMKHSSDVPRRARHAIAYGSSQSARFLRTYLYYGFNTDEQGRQVFDGVFAFGAGATRLSIDERWALPNGNGFFSSAMFPFSDTAQRDPRTGRIEGLLDNPRVGQHAPKVFYVNTASEYWGVGRSAALIHTTPDGASDILPPDNVRIYFAASTQHLGAPFPPRVTLGQQLDNTNGVLSLRGLFVALDEWVRNGKTPPASRYPRRADGTLVPVDLVRFPTIPILRVPPSIPEAKDGERVLPLLVPQVDQDGNDLAGIRSPAIAAPLATYTGWNFRNADIGAPGELVPFLGSAIPFAATRAQRETTGDSRLAIAERYGSKEQYLSVVRKAFEQLASERYVLGDEIQRVVARAEELWTLYISESK